MLPRYGTRYESDAPADMPAAEQRHSRRRLCRASCYSLYAHFFLPALC